MHICSKGYLCCIVVARSASKAEICYFPISSILLYRIHVHFLCTIYVFYVVLCVYIGMYMLKILQCQTYMVFSLYENLPNKLTYVKEPETKKVGQFTMTVQNASNVYCLKK